MISLKVYSSKYSPAVTTEYPADGYSNTEEAEKIARILYEVVPGDVFDAFALKLSKKLGVDIESVESALEEIADGL